MATSILGGINQEVTQQELLTQATMLLAAIFDKLPRTDANDRMVCNLSDQGNVSTTIASGTVTTVTTCSTVSNQTNIGGRDASHVAYAMANIGTAHIYNQIIVS